MSRVKRMNDGLNKAELKARQRDRDIEDHNTVDLEEMTKNEEKANSLGYGLYKIKSKNQANFIQVIEDNWDIVIRSGYLKGGELSLLMSIQSLIGFNVNAVLDKESGQFMSISDISRYVKIDRSTVSKTVKSLIKKGILFEFVNTDEIKAFGRSVTSRTLFVNPELFYAGDRNKIDGTLALLVAEYDKLERNGVLLDWKVWKEPKEAYGKLYRRRTYLERKKS